MFHNINHAYVSIYLSIYLSIFYTHTYIYIHIYLLFILLWHYSICTSVRFQVFDTEPKRPKQRIARIASELREFREMLLGVWGGGLCSKSSKSLCSVLLAGFRPRGPGDGMSGSRRLAPDCPCSANCTVVWTQACHSYGPPLLSLQTSWIAIPSPRHTTNPYQHNTKAKPTTRGVREGGRGPR